MACQSHNKPLHQHIDISRSYLVTQSKAAFFARLEVLPKIFVLPVFFIFIFMLLSLAESVQYFYQIAITKNIYYLFWYHVAKNKCKNINLSLKKFILICYYGILYFVHRLFY